MSNPFSENNFRRDFSAVYPKIENFQIYFYVFLLVYTR